MPAARVLDDLDQRVMSCEKYLPCSPARGMAAPLSVRVVTPSSSSRKSVPAKARKSAHWLPSTFRIWMYCPALTEYATAVAPSMRYSASTGASGSGRSAHPIGRRERHPHAQGRLGGERPYPA